MTTRHYGSLQQAMPGHWLARLCCGLLLILTLSLAQAQQAVPALTGHVVDNTGTLDATQRQQLETKLAAFEQSSGAQIVLLLVPTTQPEDIASYANRVANSWKIGRREIGDGLLVIVARDDRKVRIEVAKTLEGAIPDLAAKRVIDQAVTPHFRQGDYAGGLDAATDQLMALVRGEALPAPPSRSARDQGDLQWHDLAILLFVAIPVVAGVARKILGSKLGAVATGGIVGTVALLITSSLVSAVLAAVGAMLFALVAGVAPGSGMGIGSGRWGGGGGWGSGSGGGGFSSGGGGDFGGGGASGDW